MIFQISVLHFFSPNAVNFTVVGIKSDARSPQEVVLEYVIVWGFTGSHGSYLEEADAKNNAFTNNVRIGNFSHVMHDKSYERNASLLRNVSSFYVSILNVDHVYNSFVPTIASISSDSEVFSFYTFAWVRYVVFAIVFVAAVGVCFSMGFHWNSAVLRTKKHLRKVFVEAKVDSVDNDVSESDSETESDNGWL